MFFCIPIIFGCNTRIKRQGEQNQRQCPRCHNPSLFPARRTTWFELFWVPLIPVGRKYVWMCDICNYALLTTKHELNQPAGVSLVPMAVNRPAPLKDDQLIPPNRPGYRPAYIYPTVEPKVSQTVPVKA